MNLQKPEGAKGPLAGVLYCSQATDEMSAAELEKIIKISRRNNNRRGITGVMVYGGGMFMQWLEGPRYEVRKLMASIALDPRHEAVVYLHKMVDLDRRCYPSWAMQSVAPHEIRDCFSDCLSLVHNGNDRELILQMITFLETSEYEPSGLKLAVKPASHASLGKSGLISVLRNWLLGSSKKFINSRLLSFL